MSQTEEVTACIEEHDSGVFDMSMDSYPETQPVSQPIPIPESKIRKIRVEDSDEEEEGTIRPGTNRYKRMKFVDTKPRYTTPEEYEEMKFSEEFLRNADPWWREMDEKFTKLIQEIEEGVERIDKIYEKVFRKK